MDIKKTNIQEIFHYYQPYMEEIKESCLPFLKQYNFSHVWYSRIYPDGSIIDLGIELNWFQYMLENKYFEFLQKKRFHPDCWPKDEIKFMYTPADAMNLSPNDRRTIIEKYSVFYFFNIILNKEKYLESFGFAAPPEHYESVSIYTRYFGVFKAFGVFFSKKFDFMLRDIEKNGKLFFPFSKSSRFSEIGTLLEHNQMKIEENWTRSNLKRFFISTNYGDISITSRQRQCLSILAQGKSCKEAARILNLSPRTIESHLLKLKDKTGLFSQSALLQAFIQSGL